MAEAHVAFSAIMADQMILVSRLQLAFYIALFALILTFPVFRYPKIAFNLRMHGILCGSAMSRLIPWNRITECRWIRPKTWCGISLCRRIPRFFQRGHVTINENGIAAGQKEAITAIVERFTPVYDCDGTLLAQPVEAIAQPTTVSQPNRFRFQFSLQSLLLFFVVASCVASLLGIHYRRLQPQREAMARLMRFSPAFYGAYGVPWALEFSNCTRKPNDADLADVAMLSYLDSLVSDGRSDHRRRAEIFAGAFTP